MRRIALAVVVALSLVWLPATAGYADPTPAATLPVPAATPGQPICAVDSALSSLAGLVATADGYAVVNKSNPNGPALRLYLLDSKCARVGTGLAYTGSAAGGARDPRDLALSPDGSAFWVADTGDDVAHPVRANIALWRLPVDKTKGTLYHFAYPTDGDGPHSADAMLLNGDGTPIFVTRVLSGAAGIYVPTAAPDPAKTVPLRKVGDFLPQKTGTDNRFGPVGQLAVTGGANSPGGKHVALRTQSDAYEWDVPDGDVVKALTTTQPRITPLPDEPDGEAIAYSHDGKTFVTVSSVPDSGGKTSILRYTPASPATPTKSAAVGGTGAVPAAPKVDTRGWFSRLTLQQLTYLVGGVGLIGLLMVIGGVLGIRTARRRPQPVPPGPPTGRARPVDRRAGGELPDGPPGVLAPVPDMRYREPGGYDDERYEAELHAGMDYPPARGGYPGPPGYGDRGGYDQGGHGESGAPPGGVPPRRPAAERGQGRTYQSGGRADAYDDGGRGGNYSGGTYQSGATYQSGGTYQDGGTYRSGGREGGTYQGGSHQGNDFGPPEQAAYQPPPPAAAPPPPAPPAAAPPRTAPPPRGDGIAKSHRGRAPRARGVASTRGGYAEEHDGFDDLRRLSEED
jgi:hypothetical protein